MRLGLHHALRVLGCAALAAGLSLVLLSTGSAGGKKSVSKVDVSKLVWPAPPSHPRIRFVGQYSGELQLLGKKQKQGGVLERIAGVSIAPEERPMLNKPYGVAVDSKGRVYVADTPQREVFVFDLENKKLDFRGDKAPANLQAPIGVALDDQDRLFVSDSKLHQITCFAPNGDVERVFGANELQRPAGLAVDNPLRRLYAADVGGKRIAVFDLDTLKFVRYFGEIKQGDDRASALANPNSIAVDADGLLYVTDAIVPRVIVYDTDGNFVRVWGKRGDGPGMFARPKGIAIDADGHVYVSDSQLSRVQVFSPEGQPLIAFGSYGAGPGQFMLMAGAAIDSKNRIIVVDQFPPRIQVFRYVTDAEAEALNKAAVSAPNSTEPAAADVSSAKAPREKPSGVAPAAGPDPTVEQLKKELAELKAKLAAQPQQKSDAAGKPEEPANPPAQETSGSPK